MRDEKSIDEKSIDGKANDGISTGGKQTDEKQAEGAIREASEKEVLSEDHSHSLLIKPLGTSDLLRQVEALLIRQADKQDQRRNSAAKA